MVMTYIFSIMFFSYNWVLPPSHVNRMFPPGFFYKTLSYFIIFSFVGFVYWFLAFVSSLVSNLPRLVKHRNNVALFFYTLLFAESTVICFLLWIVYFILSFYNSFICDSYSLCEGFTYGSFIYVNLMFLATVTSFIQIRKNLGIGVRDALGL